MDATAGPPRATSLVDGLGAGDASARLSAALRVGTRPDPAVVDALVERCAVEPDFFVRDMLTWALTRLPADITVPRLVAELTSDRAQARSQALHTLSKVGDRRAWPSITRELLHDPDDEVARSAWRAAVVLVTDGERAGLAADLATRLGRGDRTVQRSLSRALVELSDVAAPVLRAALASGGPAVRVHVRATERLLRDPEAAFDVAVDEARRIVALGPDEEIDGC